MTGSEKYLCLHTVAQLINYNSIYSVCAHGLFKNNDIIFSVFILAAWHIFVIDIHILSTMKPMVIFF